MGGQQGNPVACTKGIQQFAVMFVPPCYMLLGRHCCSLIAVVSGHAVVKVQSFTSLFLTLPSGGSHKYHVLSKSVDLDNM